jgi:hypothetical protein
MELGRISSAIFALEIEAEISEPSRERSKLQLIIRKGFIKMPLVFVSED